MIWIITLGVFVWWLVGFAGFIFWWTSKHALLATDLLLAILAGFTGPFAWLAGYCIHGPISSGKIIIEKR